MRPLPKKSAGCERASSGLWSEFDHTSSRVGRAQPALRSQSAHHRRGAAEHRKAQRGDGRPWRCQRSATEVCHDTRRTDCLTWSHACCTTREGRRRCDAGRESAARARAPPLSPALSPNALARAHLHVVCRASRRPSCHNFCSATLRARPRRERLLLPPAASAWGAHSAAQAGCRGFVRRGAPCLALPGMAPDTPLCPPLPPPPRRVRMGEGQERLLSASSARRSGWTDARGAGSEAQARCAVAYAAQTAPHAAVLVVAACGLYSRHAPLPPSAQGGTSALALE